ncbi:MAG: hypothetical protein ACRDHF_04025 [Tepidiformaceae bacterium]
MSGSGEEAMRGLSIAAVGWLAIMLTSTGLGLWQIGEMGGAEPAAAKCTSDPRSHSGSYPLSRHVGSYRPATSVTGVYANLYNYSPYVHYFNTYNSSVSAWVMIRNSNSSFKYAQVGWIEFPGGLRKTFKESRNDGPWAFYLDRDPEPTNVFRYYTVLYNNAGTGYVSYQVAGSTVTEWTEYLPINPNRGEIAGETHTSADQMPGSWGGTKMYFGNAHVYISGSWQNFDGYGINANSTWYSLYGISTTDMQIWDNYCQF